MLDRFSALKPSDQQRAIGWSVLAAGLAGAAGFYWVNTRTVDRAISDATALGYTRSLQHGLGVMMGSFGLMLADWQQSLMTALGQALMIAICAALLAGYFFRVASVLDAEEKES